MFSPLRNLVNYLVSRILYLYEDSNVQCPIGTPGLYTKHEKRTNVYVSYAAEVVTEAMVMGHVKCACGG